MESLLQWKAALNFETASLSHQSMSRRICDINNQLESQLKSEMEDRKFFAVMLDKSTDVLNVSQYLFF